ncbi:hypothetical protein H1Q78_01160 [Cellulosimicrobium cellulans]|uniref:hypothetical protein n=1 Tax=Cellulosimicrobium cellulans TaxID=1710 RepID=UPI001EDADCA3|nr:hypothetical protein [Cellulosimicrobium cellulans]UKJ64125.1 hypothetical protein H1Q78_01160 [Cellulosimicrobium cellulans]
MNNVAIRREQVPGGELRVAWFHRPPEAADRERLLESGLDGIGIETAARLERDSLDWLDEFRCRYLHVNTRSLPPIPKATQHRLEHLSLFGRLARRDVLQTENLPALRTLSADDDHLAGELSRLEQLEGLHLGKVRDPDLARVGGCTGLLRLRFECSLTSPNRVAYLDPGTELPLLSEMEIDRGRIVTLDGIERLPALQYLVVVPTSVPEDVPRIDVKPLAGCRQLNHLAIGLNGRLEGVRYLEDLTDLHRLTEVEGWSQGAPADSLKRVWNAAPRLVSAGLP